MFEVDRNFVYQMTGQPHPQDIREILEVLLEGEDLKTSYESKNFFKEKLIN